MKSEQKQIDEMVTNQLRWASGELSDYHVVNMGRLNEFNGPGAYLFPDFDTADNFASEEDAKAMSMGIDRNIQISIGRVLAVLA